MSVKAFFVLLGLIVVAVLGVGAYDPDLMRPAGIVGVIAVVVLMVVDHGKDKDKGGAGSRKSAKASARR